MSNKLLTAALLAELIAMPVDITGTGAIKPGEITALNEARLTSSTYSEALTAFTAGYKDPENNEEALEWIAPAIQVSRRFEFKKSDPKDAFISDVDDIRAIGSEFKRVEASGVTVNEKTLNKGLMYRIDRDDDLVSEEVVVARLQSRLLRNELRRAYALAVGAATNTAKTWGASAQPDEDMRAAVAAHQVATGIFPNRGVIAQAAWNLRKGAYAAQQNAGATAGYLKTSLEVGQDLGLDDLRKDRALFQLTASAKQQLLVSKVLFYFAQSGLMKDDPSAIKRFVTPPEGGGKFRVYRKEEGKFVDIIVEHYSNVVVALGGIQSLTIS